SYRRGQPRVLDAQPADRRGKCAPAHVQKKLRREWQLDARASFGIRKSGAVRPLAEGAQRPGLRGPPDLSQSCGEIRISRRTATPCGLPHDKLEHVERRHADAPFL